MLVPVGLFGRDVVAKHVFEGAYHSFRLAI